MTSSNAYNSPEISVIMPFYNQEEFLEEALCSILKQSFAQFECWLVDDCSTDNSLRIAERYAKGDSRLKIIKNTQNRGLARCINQALDQALGRYIARMDGDDIALPNRFAQQKKFLDNNPDIVLVGTQYQTFNQINGVQINVEVPTKPVDIATWLEEGKNSFAHPSIMFRHEPTRRYREKFRYSQDFDFYLMLHSQGHRMANLPYLLLHYRIQPNSSSFAKRLQQAYFKREAFRFFLERQMTGDDLYDSLDEAAILDLENKPTTDPFLVRHKIEALFKLNEMSQAREWMHKYFRTEGYFNKFFVYWWVSFLPTFVLNKFRIWLWK